MNQIQRSQVLSQSHVEPEETRAGQWYRPVLFEGQPALALSEQFQKEMDKMKQLLDAVMDRFSRMNMIRQCAGSSFHVSRMSQVYMSPGFTSSPAMSAYEYWESHTHTYSESEMTRFFANGIVNTADGNQIDFSFEMNMERSFFREESVAWSEKGFTLIDPLIVTTGVTTPQLFGAGFSFDLDLDGTLDTLRPPGQGTGFLALDKNRDGRINDGGELFGPGTGDGFKELAAYDLDRNFWIDENDAVFDDLILWEQDQQGIMHLTRIREAGIGAIYLAGVNTAFDLKNRENELLARVKKSSIALNQDGSVSSVQEVDWTA